MRAALASLRAALGRRRASARHACTLVAIARDEEPYIAEWLAFHLAVGVSRILVFDHGSRDDTASIVARAGRRVPAVSLHPVPPDPARTPQLAAYAAALPLVETPWVAFLDIDEFLVPWRDGSVPAYLARVPDDVAAVHVNWRSFGSSGLVAPGYGRVTEAFRRCAEPDWAYQGHYKTLARRERIVYANIHEVAVTHGRRTLSDFTDVDPAAIGSAGRIAYDGIQLNHYQAKTRAEFDARMRLPRADAPDVARDEDRDLRFMLLDRNEVEDRAALMFRDATAGWLARIE